MPKIFEDKIGEADIQILDSTNWTVHSAILPNGDNAVEKETETDKRTFGIVGSDLSIIDRDTMIEFWIRPHSDWPTNKVLIEASTISGGYWQFSFTMNDINGTTGDAQLYMSQNKGAAVNIMLSIDEWHHIVAHTRTNYTLTINAIGFIVVYVDGVLTYDTFSSMTAGRPSGAPADCGLHLMHPSELSYCDIAELAWYNRYMTETEIVQHYNVMNSSF